MAQNLPRSEFITWAKSLTQSQLQAEIERERVEQKNREQTLSEVQKRISDLEAALQDEKLTDQTEKIEARKSRLEQLKKIILEFNNQADSQKKRIAYYRNRFDEANETVARINAEVTWQSFLPQNEARKRTAKRSAAAYKGYLGREQDLYDRLVAFRASSVAEYAAISRWLRSEQTLQERLNQILGAINFWRDNAREIQATIIEEAWRIEYKLTLVKIEGELQRITVNYYLIIHEETHDYPRDPNAHYRRKGGIKYRNKVKYPKGAFQAFLECDAFIDGGVPKYDELFKILDAVMREDVAREFMEEFKNPTIDGSTTYKQNDLELDPEGRDFTQGIVSIRPKREEIGKPPLKLYLERMSEGKNGWVQGVERYLMKIEAYDALVADLSEYRSVLRRNYP